MPNYAREPLERIILINLGIIIVAELERHRNCNSINTLKLTNLLRNETRTHIHTPSKGTVARGASRVSAFEEVARVQEAENGLGRWSSSCVREAKGKL